MPEPTILNPSDLEKKLKKLSQLESIAPAFGHKPEDIQSFANTIRTQLVAERGIPVDQIQKEPDLLRVQAAQVVKPDFQVPLTPVQEKTKAAEKTASAIANVTKQGGAGFLKKLGSKEERAAVAEDIEASGGWNAYKETLPLDVLLDDKESDEVKKQTDLLRVIETAVPLFAQESATGTGPLARFIPGFAAGRSTREKREYVSDIQSQFIKAISGATVAEGEVKRLRGFLPDAGKTETENLQNLERLRDGIITNQRLFEIAKRQGITPYEAYVQFGESLGIPISEAQKQTAKSKVSAANTASGAMPGNKVGRFMVEVE